MKLVLTVALLSLLVGFLQAQQKTDFNTMVRELIGKEIGIISRQIQDLPGSRDRARIWKRAVILNALYTSINFDFWTICGEMFDCLPGTKRKQWSETFESWALMFPPAFNSESHSLVSEEDDWVELAYQSIAIAMWSLHMDQPKDDFALKTISEDLDAFFKDFKAYSFSLEGQSRAFYTKMAKLWAHVAGLGKQ